MEHIQQVRDVNLWEMTLDRRSSLFDSNSIQKHKKTITRWVTQVLWFNLGKYIYDRYTLYEKLKYIIPNFELVSPNKNGWELITTQKNFALVWDEIYLPTM